MAKAKKIVNGENGLVCAFCGKVKDTVSFVIGACSKKPDWCMIYGTGKMACPDCYEKGSKEAEVLGEKHVAEHNAACEKSMFLTPAEMESSKKTVIYTANPRNTGGVK